MSYTHLGSYYDPDYGTFYNLRSLVSSEELCSLDTKDCDEVLFTPWSVYDKVFSARRRLSYLVLDHTFDPIPIATILTFNVEDDQIAVLEANKSAFTGGVFKFAGALRMLGTFENIMMLNIILPKAVVHNCLFIPKTTVESLTQDIVGIQFDKLFPNVNSSTNDTVMAINKSLVDLITRSCGWGGK